MAMLTIRYDLRVPPFASVTHPELYSVCLDQCAWADDRGFDTAVLSEHHFVEDGYMSAPLVLAAAIGARTHRILINVAAVLVYQLLRDEEAKTGAVFLGREVRLKQPALVFRRDAAAIVNHVHLN